MLSDFNIDEFLQPITPIDDDNNNDKNTQINECGKYLKYDYIYDQIKELRREDDPRLTQGIWQIEPKKAAWSDVKKVCESALKNQTKDLQIAVWWLEAMTALEGFSGLDKGIILLNGLCERFWDNIWPAIDLPNKDFTARLAPFYFFAEKISDKIILIPLMNPSDGVSNIFSLSDWISVRHSMHMKNNNSDAIIKDFQKSVSLTPIEFLLNIDDKVSSILKNLKKLEDVLDNYCKDKAPSFRYIYDNLNDIKQINTKHITDRKQQLDIEENKREKAKIAARQKEIQKNKNERYESEIDNDDSNEDDDKKNAAAPTIEQAYSALSEIAVFLEKEQPQSPSSILIKIASEIGKKTFQELLEINTKNGISLMGTISELYNVLKKDDHNNRSGSNEKDEEKEKIIVSNSSGIPPGFEF